MVDRALRRFAGSLGVRLVVLAAAFAAVPVFVYQQFQEAELGRRQALLKTVQAEGQVLGEALRIALETSGRELSVAETRALMERISPPGTRMRLLFRPAGGERGLYLIAGTPAVAPDAMEAERRELVQSGIADLSPASCEGAGPLDLRYDSRVEGSEVLTAITPFPTSAGCWTIITSHSFKDAVGSLLGRPYWKAREVRLAAAIYGSLALLVLLVFGGLWRGLHRFGRQAQAIAAQRREGSFESCNLVPELDGVAREFDRMVASLRRSADAFRHAAEDNAHAFKTPIATIAQALEPLRRAVPQDDASGRRSLQLIENSVARLDALLAASRRMDETNASLVNPAMEKTDLSRLVEGLLASYDETAAEKGVVLARRLIPKCRLRTAPDLLETALENVMDNALSFSPPGGSIFVSLGHVGSEVEILVEDEGPGVPPEMMTLIFERYTSHRPSRGEGPGEQHFGIGLWIARRNVEALGGSVTAENREGKGLRVTVKLPAGR